MGDILCQRLSKSEAKAYQGKPINDNAVGMLLGLEMTPVSLLHQETKQDRIQASSASSAQKIMNASLAHGKPKQKVQVAVAASELAAGMQMQHYALCCPIHAHQMKFGFSSNDHLVRSILCNIGWWLLLPCQPFV